MRHLICTVAFGAAVVLMTANVGAQLGTEDVGIEQHLGERIPLAELHFTGEDGQPVALADLFDRPVILTLVYFRCPGICTPLLKELSHAVENAEVAPGEDFRMVTISFEPEEGPELARKKRDNMIAAMDRNAPTPDEWRFLVGDEANIRRITEAVGFRYIRDPNEVDYVHAASIMFLSEDGTIARYLNTMRLNPADLELAVIDAADGRARSFMQKIQRLCYSYEPESHVYVLKLNRIILAVTAVFVLLFLAFLLVKPSTKRAGPAEDGAIGEVSS